MASSVFMVKQPGGLLKPAGESDSDLMQSVGNGATLKVSFTQPRNYEFHKRFFAMVNFAFDYWEPQPVEIRPGEFVTPEKNRERFRKDLLIYAGYRTMVVNIRNEVRYEAESISFANMSPERFQDVYKAVFDVVWQLVLSKVSGMTEQEAERCILQTMGFSS